MTRFSIVSAMLTTVLSVVMCRIEREFAQGCQDLARPGIRFVYGGYMVRIWFLYDRLFFLNYGSFLC